MLLAGCGSGVAIDSDPGMAPVDECDGPAGSWTDLSSEPEWFRDDSGARINWTDDNGCAINLEYVFHRFGDDHCEWETIEMLSIGIPIGTPYTGDNADPPGQDWEPLFFHNGAAAATHLEAGTTLAELPVDAVDTGLRAAGDRALFSSPDEDVLYLQQGGEVLVFVAGTDEELSCA